MKTHDDKVQTVKHQNYFVDRAEQSGAAHNDGHTYTQYVLTGTAALCQKSGISHFINDSSMVLLTAARAVQAARSCDSYGFVLDVIKSTCIGEVIVMKASNEVRYF